MTVELTALVGHRFPGGTYRVAHWENWLLTECTGRAPMPDGLVHPIVLFHAPILGAGTSIEDRFRLGGASGASGSVGLVGYDWEYFIPLREAVDYFVEGGIVAATRHHRQDGSVHDDVVFTIELADADGLVARVTNTWRFRRTPPRPAGPAGPAPQVATGRDDLEPGADLPRLEMPSVDAARMKTMAAILRDPYPVHWDREANTRLGLAGRVVNQGPLNLGYIANTLMAWAGPASIRRLTVAFGRPVLDGDHVVAGGCVRNTAEDLAQCDVWLDRAGELVVTGTAEMIAPTIAGTIYQG